MPQQRNALGGERHRAGTADILKYFSETDRYILYNGIIEDGTDLAERRKEIAYFAEWVEETAERFKNIRNRHYLTRLKRTFN